MRGVGGSGCSAARLLEPTRPFPPIAPVGTGAQGGNRCDAHAQVVRETETGAASERKWREARLRLKRAS